LKGTVSSLPPNACLSCMGTLLSVKSQDLRPYFFSQSFTRNEKHDSISEQ